MVEEGGEERHKARVFFGLPPHTHKNENKAVSFFPSSPLPAW